MKFYKKAKKRFYNKLDKIAFKYDLKRRAEKANNRGSRYGYATLTKEEKQEIKCIWGDYGGKYHAFGFYKQFCGVFSPFFVPDDYYDFAEHVFNLRWAAFFLQHKCNMKYIVPAKNRAKVIVQKIDGHFVLEDNTEISKEETVALLKKHEVFMRKVARGTGGGKGVSIILLKEINDFDELLHGNDIEFEEIVQQNDFLAQFNPDSVNTIRLVTLNINEKCTVLSAFFRMGSKGSFVDNFCSGVGTLVGVNNEGYLNEFGVDKNFNKIYKAPTGLEFKGIQIPNYFQIKQQIIDFHKKIPYANLIGWDITLDINLTPIIIEVNLDSAHLALHQIFNGPIFGDRLSEVKDYIERRRSTLWHQMITY